MVARLASRRVSLEDSFEDVNEWLYREGLTDGLPVVPPTEERVQRMVAAMPGDPQEVVAEVPPAHGQATLEKIAINAVMAGCLPEYMPVLVSAVQAMTSPPFNIYTVQATTNPCGPMLVLNGPIRKELDVNCGHGALGPGRRANATMGRAIRLILLNLGGATPGEVDKATLGYTGKYTACLGENEEASPWAPLHVERGLARDSSAVTVVGAIGSTNIIDNGSKRAEDLLRTIAGSMTALGSNNWDCQGEAMVILCPEHALMMAAEGLSKADVQLYLYQHTSIPLDSLSPGMVEKIGRKDREVIDGMLYLTPRPQDIILVVSGGDGPHSVHIPTMGGHSTSVTRPIIS